MGISAADYDAFAPALWSWNSVDDFLASEVEEGVHRISQDADCANTLDIQLFNWAREVREEQAVVPVFFSAAVGARNGRPAPFFSGAGMAGSDGYAAIAISDPSLALSPDIALAWYAGSRGHRVQDRLASFLARMADVLGKELLLVGGSGGGYAACFYGALLGPRASVFVWNPQTDILRYYRSAVSDYLSKCFGAGFKREEQARRVLESNGIRSELASVYAEHEGPRRCVYLQNVSDRFHVEGHALPFLSGLKMRPASRKGFLLSPDGRVAALFGAWSEGHDAPPKTMVRAVIRRMLNPQAGSNAIGRWIMASPFAGDAPTIRYPLVFGPETSLEVDACKADRMVRAQASGGGSEGCTPAAYAFYLLDREERIDTRWYEPEPNARFVTKVEDARTVVAFAKDDLGNMLQASCPIKDGPDDGFSLPEGSRIFILGSCVSRDTFAYFSQEDKLAGYMARTSLACAFDPRTPSETCVDLASITSSWQRKMVRADLRREVGPSLESASFDALVLDFIDERFSIGFVDGAPVTLSPEFLSAKRSVEIESRLRPDREGRWAMWCKGIEALVEQVGPRRMILNQALWATHLEDGTKLVGADKAIAMNRLLRRMYDHVTERFGVRSVVYPRQVIVGARQHKWGVSPFHYSLGFYKHTMHEIGRLLT
ncbi:DUF6270 domain-containing protein [Marilutibacter chinensis]|uniref:DUF6270 domain-containing protein n=1 Tax=Marilutibacter chinensis TaxID=2912247 RepID=A0ABS9HTA9_9GAMM|nr:DUF6270 domain-containing protein [Lysobacter chinensis]MCF7221317.1 DUF6270 domain-containing protein [Lysobacter chinensis]